MKQSTIQQIEQVVKGFPSNNVSLVIPILQKVQETFGYVPPESIGLISRHTGVARSRIYGVLTFYEGFKAQPSAKYKVRLCRGVTCHQKDPLKIFKETNKEHKGRKFSLETIPCPGFCYLVPLMIINDQYYGNVTLQKAKRILGN